MRTWILLIIATLCGSIASAAEPVLRPGDRLAICGDSITEQRVYSVMLETYLLACKPAANVTAVQFGWGGETSWQFLPRIEHDVLPFEPTVATIHYGMNDGGYAALTPEREKQFRDAMSAVVRKFQEAGVRVIVASPGCVDTHYFDKRYTPGHHVVYNKALATLRDIARDVAAVEQCPFADVYGAMFDVQAKAKARYGPEYPLAGPDGFHPVANGHLVIAYALLKALGCDGDLGTITLDAVSGKATATGGHEIVSAQSGIIMLKSSRYPFCFYGDPAGPNEPTSPYSTKGILDFLPFNEDLNRFRLVVTGLSSDFATVTWGGGSKAFSKAELQAGINLAAEFLDNPFSEPLKRVEQAVRRQQDFETPMIRNLVNGVRELLPEERTPYEQLLSVAMKKDAALAAAASQAVVPVTHTIRIQP
ncbi:MAG TPA: SGNH/GDSL hydrolase family protein [Tepidisphaeraceae bacterium]|nr:SGNH/GDSL hydrolase family protein [Tepidisphaeraceae bacterium]